VSDGSKNLGFRTYTQISNVLACTFTPENAGMMYAQLRNLGIHVNLHVDEGADCPLTLTIVRGNKGFDVQCGETVVVDLNTMNIWFDPECVVPQSISSEDEYHAALKRIDKLMYKQFPTPLESAELSLLVDAVGDYERENMGVARHFRVSRPHPAEVIQRMIDIAMMDEEVASRYHSVDDMWHTLLSECAAAANMTTKEAALRILRADFSDNEGITRVLEGFFDTEEGYWDDLLAQYWYEDKLNDSAE